MTVFNFNSSKHPTWRSSMYFFLSLTSSLSHFRRYWQWTSTMHQHPYKPILHRLRTLCASDWHQQPRRARTPFGSAARRNPRLHTASIHFLFTFPLPMSTLCVSTALSGISLSSIFLISNLNFTRTGRATKNDHINRQAEGTKWTSTKRICHCMAQ